MDLGDDAYDSGSSEYDDGKEYDNDLDEYVTPSKDRYLSLPPVLKRYASDTDTDEDEEDDVRKRLRFYRKRKEMEDDSDEVRAIKKRVQTEDLGKTFERAICRAYDIPYQGKYKYGTPDPKLKQRLKGLKDHFGVECRHTADRGARYDFTSDTGYLSAKTSKQRVGKVAPQVVGQTTLNRFRIVFGIEEDVDIKKYIQENILRVLPILENYTFDSDNVYYNEPRDLIQHIHRLRPIDWEGTEEHEHKYEWTRDYREWTNSSTLKMDGTPLLEVQIHSKNRKNLAIRWYYDNLLRLFKDNFRIVVLE